MGFGAPGWSLVPPPSSITRYSFVIGDSQASHVSPLPGLAQNRPMSLCGKRPSRSFRWMRRRMASSSIGASTGRVAGTARFEWSIARGLGNGSPPVAVCPIYGDCKWSVRSAHPGRTRAARRDARYARRCPGRSCLPGRGVDVQPEPASTPGCETLRHRWRDRRAGDGRHPRRWLLRYEIRARPRVGDD